MPTEMTRIELMSEPERSLINILTPQERKDALVQAARLKQQEIYERTKKQRLEQMEPGTIFLNVPLDFVVEVSRFTQAKGGITIEEATNTNELTQEAEQEVIALCGGLNQPGFYPISSQLAQKAQF